MKKTTLLFLTFASSLMWQTTNAAIVYTNNADQTLGSGGSLAIDFNNDGSAEFTFQDMGFGGAVEPGIIFVSNNHHLTTVSTGEWDVMRGVSAGFTIDAFAGFFDMGDAYVDPGWGTTMFPTTDTYIGAQFRNGTSDYFGWILVNWNANGTFIVKSFAYESTPNTAITAGATGQSAALMENSITDFNVYPIPAQNSITLSTDAPTSILITDAQGNKLGSRFVPKTEIVDISDYKAGIYFVSLPNGQRTRFIKI